MKSILDQLRDPKLTCTKGFIEKEDRGDSVKKIESFINWLYGCSIQVDGYCGPITDSWIRKFQTDYGLVVDGKWGHKTWTKAIAIKDIDRFLSHMKYYHEYVKKNGSHFKRKNSPDKTFDAVRKKIAAGKTVYLNCNAAIRWSFHDMDYSPSTIYAKSGSFRNTFKGSMTKKLKRVKSGGPIGKTVKSAVDGKLLKKGDICCFAGFTHTFTYTGKGYLFYDGGGAAESRGYKKVGMCIDYTKVASYKNRKISEVLRWI